MSKYRFVIQWKTSFVSAPDLIDPYSAPRMSPGIVPDHLAQAAAWDIEASSPLEALAYGQLAAFQEGWCACEEIVYALFQGRTSHAHEEPEWTLLPTIADETSLISNAVTPVTLE